MPTRFAHSPAALGFMFGGLALAFGACTLTPPPAQIDEQKAKTLELASTDWKPFTAPEGQPRVANELVAEALRSDAITATQVILPIDEWLAALESGEVQGSAAIWWSEERAKTLVFSDPYLENRLVLIGRKDADVSATSFEQLEGKRIGIVEGYAYGEAVENVDPTTGPTFVAMPSTPDNVRALLAGELDYVLADELYAVYGRATHPQVQDLVIGEIALVTRTLHFAVRKDVPEVRAIVDDFDDRVRQMKRDGTYNAVLGLDWIEADIDGDGQLELVFAGDQVGTEPPARSYRVETPKSFELEVQPDYVINGRTYESWEHVPDAMKTTGVGGSNVGIGIRW
jgi:polar amino acid transport system substrate-binding protein